MPVSAAASMVLLPGEETAIEQMLRLPQDTPCRYLDAKILKNEVEARYVCPDNTAPMLARLRHAEQPLTNGTTAGQWTVAASNGQLQQVLAKRAQVEGQQVRWHQAEQGTTTTPQQPGPVAVSRNPHHNMTDGVLVSVLVLIVLIGLTRESLRGHPRHIAWILAGLTVWGAVLRGLLSPNTGLGVWSYFRLQWLSVELWYGPVLPAIQQFLGGTLHLVSLTHTVTLLAAIATPVAVFVHGSQLFRSPTTGLLAAALLVHNPSHLRFSHSESEMIGSLLLATLTLGLVHTALSSQRQFDRVWACLAYGPMLLVALMTREANLAMMPVIVGAIAISYHRAVRRVAVGLMVATVATLATYVHLSLLDRLRHGPPVDYVQSILGIPAGMLDPERLVLLNMRVTPPLDWLLLALAIPGLRQRSGIGWYLGIWLVAYTFVHLLVGAETAEMSARYQLHLLSPLLLLAAAGFAEALRRWPRSAPAAWIVVALTPWIHSSFIQDVAMDDIMEYHVARDWSNRLPENCDVVEYSGVFGDYLGASRMARMGDQLRDGQHGSRHRVHVVDGQTVPSDLPSSVKVHHLAAESPLPEGRCVVAYVGLNCYTKAAVGGEMARPCRSLLSTGPGRVLGSVQLTGRFYDFNHKMLVPLDQRPALMLIDHSTPPLAAW